MFLIRLISLVILSKCALSDLEFPISPCPNLFHYERTRNNEIRGVINLQNDLTGNYRVEVNMTLAGFSNQNIVIKRITPGPAIQNGEDITYNIFFPISRTAPEIASIVFNNRILCTSLRSPDQGGGGITSLTALDFYSTPINSNIRRPYRPKPQQQQIEVIETYHNMPSNNEPINIWQDDVQYTPPLKPMNIIQHGGAIISTSPLKPVSVWQNGVPVPATSIETISYWQNGILTIKPVDELQIIAPTKFKPWQHGHPVMSSSIIEPVKDANKVPKPTKVIQIPKATVTHTIITSIWHNKPSTATIAPVIKPTSVLEETDFSTMAPVEVIHEIHPTVETPELATTHIEMTQTNFTVVNNRYFDVEECGVVEDTQALLVHGTPTSEGQYPWLIAMFHLQEMTGEYKFKCAGNLISTKHVVTAAHCVRLEKTSIISKQDIILVLGKHNIRSWAVRSEIRDVRDIFVHPDYQHPSDADIAILKMFKTVEYTSTIKPICLWGEKDDTIIDKIVGINGTVVGWGKDEYDNSYVPEPKQLNMPVVSQEDCLRSDERFLKLTSHRTFCAGSRKGEGPCTGDSGGGFIMRRKGKWTLRGIVSSALVDPMTRSCDVNSYMVFADVSKYMPWIKHIMKR